MDIPMVIPIGNTIQKMCDKPFLTCKYRFLGLGLSMIFKIRTLKVKSIIHSRYIN